VQPELPTQPAVKKQQTITGKQKKAAGKPTIISYRHTDKRRNNPEVGMVSESTDPDDGKDRWCYDPHIDPALQFDFGRAQVEKLIDDSLESGDPDRMRAALEDLKRYSGPYLNWTGKAERTTFDVDTVSLHVHERIDPASKLRITGPFSVEAVPFPSVLSLEKSEQPIEADAAIARYGESLYPRQVFFPMAIPGLPASRAACWSIGTTRTRVNIRSISASWRPSSR
jgi:hypothetical protein